MPIFFDRVYVEATGYFMPGDAVSNAQMDAYIAPINRASARIKQRVLQENGIQSRYYAIAPDGSTRWSNAQLAAEAARACLRSANRQLSDVDLLAVGTSGGDTIMPGFASMVQGELAAPPMQTHSSIGVCAAGVGALEFAAMQLEQQRQQQAHARALVVASDLPSRMFKSTRFTAPGYDTDFDAHFLRWMLSDGAGAMLLTREPIARNGLRLRLRWSHQKTFAGDYPVCMQLGQPKQGGKSYLDYESSSAAEADGALALRQDIRLLPHLFDVAIHEYVRLVEAGHVHPAQVDHFLCHYSSERFIPVVDDLMHKAGLSIPKERWYSNLAWRGNTGAASIFVMLAEFLETHWPKPGERIFCFVPESGRFTVAYLLFEVEAADQAIEIASSDTADHVPAPHAPEADDPRLARLLQQLAGVWHDYRSRVWRTPLVRSIRNRGFTASDYQRWMECWIPQVREGSKWMREAIASMRPPFDALASLIEQHAADEQFDFNILFQDYRDAGGRVEHIDALRRNPGGEALNSYLHALAATPSPVGLLGAIYIIEGTGQRIIPALLPLLKAQLNLPPSVFRFLDYHGANDEHHLARWLTAATLVLQLDDTHAADQAIIDIARRTADLYLLQMEHAYRNQLV